MGSGIRSARKGLSLPCCAFLLAVLMPAMVLALLHTDAAQAQTSKEDEWFTVTFQEGGDLRVYVDGDPHSDIRPAFFFLNDLYQITVYKNGSARAEMRQPERDGVAWSCSFEGSYNSRTRTLTGTYEAEYSRSDEYEDAVLKETYKGTLEGTLEYRENEVEPTIFTMKGEIRVDGTQEYTDMDGDDEDESYTHDIKIEYDFVANGNTGPETGVIDTGGDEGGSKIPGPGSWWKWLTGAVIPAAIAAGASLVTSVMGGAAPPAGPPAPSTAGGPKVPQPPPKAGGEPRGKPPADKKPRRPGQRTPGGLLEFPGEAQPFPADIAAGTAGIVEPESAVKVTLESSAAVKDGMGPAQDVAAGTADPFDLQKYPNQPGYIGDVVNENLTAAQDAVSPAVADASVALKDGVIGFVKGLASIPITALEGFVQIGRLLAETHTEVTQGGTGLFKDMTSPSVLWDTLKNISIPLGKALPELLPIEEFKSFFDSNASLEEKLWAIPSAVVKIANLIMMSEKLATKPVPGLPPMSTFIKSAKPGLAAEAALNSTDPAVQKAYDSYRKAGEAKAAGIRDTVTKGGKVSQEQVLDAMSDPATMRNIKKAPEAVQKEFNLTQTREVYQPVYKDVTSYMEGKYPGEKFRVGSVRTPGQKSLINTDNDAVVERLTYTRDGMPYWKEVPAKEWEHAYYESFSKRTGFTPEKAKARFPEKDWDSMTPQQQHKAWTEGHGQECMDVKNPEAAHAFSDQPTAMDPKWRPGRGSPVSQERIVDGEGLGHMERFKTGRGWKGPEATLQTQTEAMEQGCKLCGLSKKLAQQSMKRTGKVIEYPEVFKQGEEILNMRDLSPQVRDQALKNIGFEGGYEEFMDKLSSWTGALP